MIAEILNLRSNWNFEFMATFWIANKKHAFTNIISLAVIWCLWNFRKKMCFQGLVWMGKKSSVALDCQDVKMETNVRSRPGDQGGLCDSGVGDVGEPASKTLLGWGNAIKVGDVGFSVLGTGLRRCDSLMLLKLGEMIYFFGSKDSRMSVGL
jgi:hypothetical protein